MYGKTYGDFMKKLHHSINKITISLSVLIVTVVIYVMYQYMESRQDLVLQDYAPQSNGGIFFPIDDPRHPGGPNYNPKLFEIQEAAQSTSTVDMTPISVQSDQSQ
jgi:hypothetical protein